MIGASDRIPKSAVGHVCLGVMCGDRKGPKSLTSDVVENCEDSSLISLDFTHPEEHTSTPWLMV